MRTKSINTISRAIIPDSLIASASIRDRGLPSEQDVDDALAFCCLNEFVRQAWPYVDTRSYVPNWHIDAIATHLEAVTYGKIHRLIINVPPRHTKSLLVSVFWPAWEWLHNPKNQFLFSAYAETLSIRDSVKCRRLMQTPWYRRLMLANHPGFALMGDQNTKTRYENTLGGYRLATSVEGSNTGEGGDRLVVDDPVNVMEAESIVKRVAVNDWWDGVMTTRLNDAVSGAKVIIMQRCHENDLVGHILTTDGDRWDLLILPARYEGRNLCKSSLGYEDPRTREGELLYPARFPQEELESLEKSLGMYRAAAQLQQRPSPRSGGMFPIDKVRLVHAIDRSLITGSVRYWDKAATEGGGCQSAGVLMHKMQDSSFVVEDVQAGQWSIQTRNDRMIQTAELDRERAEGQKVKVQTWIEREPGSGGKESAEISVKELAGYPVFIDTAKIDKETRAEPLSGQVAGGNVSCMVGPWTDAFLKQLELFPKGTFIDQADAAAGSFNKLVLVKVKRAGTW